MGQVPSLDFFAPVGPLGYYGAALLDRLFPQAQPMLLVNWALLPVLLPLAAILAASVSARSRPLALALILPLLLFAALPINLHGLYPMPGFDGYGHYNRHVALLLYALIATLLFMPRGRLATGLVAALMLTLFLVKITGAVTGALLVGYAILAGRLRLRDAVLAAGIVLAALGLLDLATGIVRAYLADILALLALNTGALLPRFLTVASVKFNVVGPCLLLMGALALAAWRDGLSLSLDGLRRLAASNLGWLAAAFLALTFFETQNTGSLEYIGLWPILLLILLDWRNRSDRLRPVVLVLALAVALPSAVIVVERSARAMLGAAGHVALDVPELGPLGRVSLKPETAQRAAIMLDHYAKHPEPYRDLAARGSALGDPLFRDRLPGDLAARGPSGHRRAARLGGRQRAPAQRHPDARLRRSLQQAAGPGAAAPCPDRHGPWPQHARSGAADARRTGSYRCDPGAEMSRDGSPRRHPRAFRRGAARAPAGRLVALLGPLSEGLSRLAQPAVCPASQPRMARLRVSPQ